VAGRSPWQIYPSRLLGLTLKLAVDKTAEDNVLADAEEEEIAELQAADPGNQGA
jgi:hypothetical protein